MRGKSWVCAPVRAVLVALLAAGSWAACGGDAPGDGTGVADTGTSETIGGDVDGDDADEADAETAPVSPEEAACVDGLKGATGVSLTPNGEVAVQPALANPMLAAPGAPLLVGWTGAADNGSDLAPWFASVDCSDGSWYARPPVRLNEGADASEGQPRIAVAGDRAMVVWQRADGVENQVRYVMMDAHDGAVRGAPTNLTTRVRGEEVQGATWQPSVLALRDGSFLVTATYFDPGWETFRVYAQRIDRDGTPMGDGTPVFDVAPDDLDDVTVRWHESPTAVEAPDGRVWVAWDARTSERDAIEFVVLTPVEGASGYTVGDVDELLPSSVHAVGAPSLEVVAVEDGWRVWLAASEFSANADVMLFDVTDGVAPAEPLVVAAGERAFRTVLVAATDGDVFVVWQARDATTGPRGEVRGRWVRPRNDGLTPISSVISFDMEGRRTHLVYPIAVAPRRDGGVAVAWNASEPVDGWRTHLRFVDAP